MEKKVNSSYLISQSFYRQRLGHIYTKVGMGKDEGVTEAVILKSCRIGVLLSGLTPSQAYLQQSLISPSGQYRAIGIARLQKYPR